MRSARAANLASSAPATTSTGMVSAGSRSHSGCCVPVPARRRLDASPPASLRRRSSRPAIGERGEQRLGDPAVEERVDTVALDGRCKCIVGRAARGTLVVVLDAGGGADQDQSLDELRTGEREVEAQPAAHRVADVRGRAAGRAEQLGAGVEVGLDARRTGVARRVDRDDLEAIGQAIGDRCPRPAGLGEPVDEDEPRSGCPSRRVQAAQPARRSARRRSTCTKTSGSWAPGIDQRPSIT